VSFHITVLVFSNNEIPIILLFAIIMIWSVILESVCYINNTAPTVATEVLLGLPPLNLKIEAEAQAGIYRLSCNEQWRSKSLWYAHTSIAQDMIKEPILQMGTDMHSTDHSH
jgi:hypothetical protein